MELLHTLVAVHAEVFVASVLGFILKFSCSPCMYFCAVLVFFFIFYSLFLDPSILKL